MNFKKCAYCKKQFVANSIEKVFCSPICREKRNKSRNAWVIKNKEHVKNKQRDYYLNHTDKRKEYSANRRKNNPEYMINYRKTHEARVKETNKKYKLAHKEEAKNYISSSKEYGAEFRAKHRDSINEYHRIYHRKRGKTDVLFKLMNATRHGIFLAKMNNLIPVPITVEEAIGCTIEEYKKYIENQFKPGMSWNNWSFKNWHIDHIKPCCAFDMNDREELKKCFHYTNARPLWAKENWSKNGRHPKV